MNVCGLLSLPQNIVMDLSNVMMMWHFVVYVWYLKKGSTSESRVNNYSASTFIRFLNPLCQFITSNTKLDLFYGT